MRAVAGYIPILLDCEGRPCLVIGGGMIAERKTQALLEAKAMVTVISPELSQGLFTLYETNRIMWERRVFAGGDTQGYWMVHATTDQEMVNQRIAEEANLKGILVNVASHTEASTFLNPAVMRRGRLTIAVSTEGAGPIVATNICKLLNEEYGDEYEIYLDFLYLMRAEIKKSVNSPKQRHKLLRKLTEYPILEEIRQGRFKAWSETQIHLWIAKNEED
ncbi:precorrin-2 dehydrogenase/sirohydrochlorin ferrochelatase family protein [Paenibacillus antarcticus]|uniref:precorrin-2 dehydrogenase n=1 Tax=Paenibacillus antarcticus TaxID=253703 RepID=A0A162MFF3_9BACL|nr:bifunctional precorrin-2 dehydrogenase/sirohydrochlorin ferrochelatase [Paenibacillus antarcticus]OAB48095.1 hypothetical protein PBAT_00160 [Paenibacillus antarcticus]